MITRELANRPSCVHWIEKWTETWTSKSARRLQCTTRLPAQSEPLVSGPRKGDGKDTDHE